MRVRVHVGWLLVGLALVLPKLIDVVWRVWRPVVLTLGLEHV
ncbi:MAG: hypothetical protein ACK5YE_11980 [Planctomyces sp.]|jgi:hypothetical protein